MTSRLDQARAEYRAALEEERDRLEAELSSLLGELPAAPVPAKPKSAKKKAVAKKPSRRGRIHGAFGQPGKRSDGKPVGAKGEKRCGKCGRDGLASSRGPGHYLAFHRAPKCELPCAGANLKTLAKEDLADGVHTGADCYGCKKAVGA